MAARAVATPAAALMVAGTLLAGGASAQSPSSPSSSCTSVLVSLSPCLNFITGNETTAPASCCTQLGKVVQSDPQCLCVALNADPASLGLNVNRTRALGQDAARQRLQEQRRRRADFAVDTHTGSKKTSVDSGASPRGSASLVAGFIAAPFSPSPPYDDLMMPYFREVCIHLR